eukprot:403352895
MENSQIQDQPSIKVLDQPIIQNEPGQSEVIIAYVTVPNQEIAEKLGGLLVEKQLVACANIIPGLTSIYKWKGQIEKDSELLMMLKTKRSLFQELVNEVKANHPYECPEIISVGDVQQAYKPYYDWILKETKNT